MAAKKILVVCEGHTDFVIIEGVVNHISTSINMQFQLNMIAPQMDATTGNAERHGWTGVMRWCKLNAIKDPSTLVHLPEPIRIAAFRKNWETLIAASNADLLLVHLDTDIANDIDKNYSPIVQPRRSFCENTLNSWLGINVQKPNCKYLLPTYAIENWLLATFDATNSPHVFCETPPNYEVIFDYEDRLISLGYSKKRVKGRLRMRKSVYNYKNGDKYLKRLISNFSISKSRCPELSYFYNLVTSL